MSALPTSSASNNSGLGVSFADVDDWGNGFTANMSIAETGTGSLQGWTLSFTLAGDITDIWGATIESHVGDVYVLGNVGYNATVSPAAAATLGFVISGTDPVVAPTQFVLNQTTLNSAPAPSALPQSSAADAAGLGVSFADVNDWGNGFTANMAISETGDGTLQGWTLSFTLAGDITDIWGATIESHVGDEFVLGNVDYNAAVSSASPATLGFVISGTDPVVAPTQFVLNGETLASTAAPVVTPAPVAPLPGVSVADASVLTGPAFTAAGPGTLLPAGYLSTHGGSLVDSSGRTVVINAINWFGMETTEAAPQGLDTVNYATTMAQMVSLGFNAIRIPFSLASLNPNSMPDDINDTLNPDLAGLNSLQVLDKIVAEAGKLGIKIILDDHNSAGNGGGNANGLWYDDGYTSQDFTNDWVSLAQHYAGNATVIGFDLSNEPGGAATWGGGDPATDWKMAAQTTGDAIQQVNPNALIIVEGVQYNDGVSADLGENLTGVATDPVVLAGPDKLVYSPHVYPTSVTDNPADNDTSTLAATWTQDFGYIAQDNIAPIFIGEFGATLTNPGDQAWMTALVDYVAGNATAGSGSAAVPQMPVSWGYWDWNPDSNDTGGILLGDWTTVNQTKIEALAPALWQGAPAGGDGDVADFTVSLSAAASSAVTLQVQTVDGTAKAGVDYQALSQTVVIAAGQTTAEVSVALLNPTTANSNDVFFLQIANSSGATIAVSEASATLPAASQAAATPSTSATPAAAPSAAVTPAAMTAAPASAPDGIAAAQVTNDWGTGLTASVTVTNSGTAGTNGWEVQLSTTEDITNLWNGTIISHVGSTYLVTDAGYNGTLDAGGSTSFGFQATHEVAGEGLVAQLIKLGS